MAKKHKGAFELFELNKARKMLPLVRSITNDLANDFKELRTQGAKRQELKNPDMALEERMEDLSRRVEAQLQELVDLGVVIRDLELGIVEFPTLMQGKPAYFCWSPKDGTITSWHLQNSGKRQSLPV